MCLLFLTGGLLLAQKPEADAKEGVRLRYDRFEDVTLVTAENMLVSESKQGTLVVNVHSYFKGHTPGTLEGIRFQFISSANAPRFQDRPRLLLLVDKQSLPIGEAKAEARQVRRGVAYEQFVIPLDLQTLVYIARASSIEGRLGQTEFKFSPPDISRLRTLVEKYSTSARFVDEEAEGRRQVLRKLNQSVDKLEKQLEQSQKETADLENIERLVRAEQRAASLRGLLDDLKTKETDLRGRLEEVDVSLRPENAAYRRGTHVKLAKEQREPQRHQLEAEKTRMQEELNIIVASRKRLESAVAEADSEIELMHRQTKAPKPRQ